MRLLPVLICFLAVTFASCGGGGGGATATPGATGTVSPEAHETAEASIPDPFASLSSYDYDIKVLADGQLQVEIQGAIQGSDRIEANFIVSGSTTPIESVIIIGSQAWVNDSSTDNQWAMTDLGTAENVLAGAPPKDVLEPFAGRQVAQRGERSG